MAQADQRGISSYAESFQSSQPQPAADRPLWVAYLLWFFVGQLSAHRFYLGATSSAFKQLGLLFGSVILAFVFAPLAAIGIIAWIIWIFADLFLMPGMHRKLSQPNPSPIFS
ncbi:MAG: TM2 domain-containing protein [Sphingomonadaceae bacterium]|nr:TM2 domain-containing protein [Sphingomonadaceae bacterium]